MTSLVTPVSDAQPVDWVSVEAACFDWISDLLEINGRVVWHNQKVPQPAYPYVSLLRTSEVDAGLDEERYRTLDANDRVVGVDPGAGPPVTSETIVYQPITWTLTVHVHTDPRASGNDPNCDAMKFASKIKRSLGLRSVIDRLYDAGISVIRPLLLADTSVVVAGEWESRATLDISMCTASVLTERTEFIEKVEIQSDQLGVDLLVDAS